jgi:O-acetylhomoserine (thiol)-lyase
MDELSLNGKLLHTKYPKPDAYNALSMPVYNSAAYEFDTAEQMESAFAGKTAEFAYSRISNPTVQYFEERICTITGALSVTALNSGMAAISNTIITIAKTGSNIITSRHLFGNTYSFFANTMTAFGVETRFCDLTNLDEVEALIDANTCAVFLEIITNPQMEVVDLMALSKITKQTGVPLIADTTIMPFCVFSAKEFGIDIEIVSSTKYISGGATSLGGLILDYGNFNWMSSPKLHTMAKEVGKAAFTTKLRKEIHRNMGAYMTPQVAYMQTLGLETLSLRFEKATKTCLDLVKLVEIIPGVESVNYTGLPENKYFNLSKKQFGDYPGAMFTLNLSSREACFTFLNKLKMIKRATNLFDNKTLAIHPASTIYGNFTPEIRKEMNVSEKTIRISVGLEELDDLLTDFKQALA